MFAVSVCHCCVIPTATADVFLSLCPWTLHTLLKSFLFSNPLLSGRVQTCGPHVERCPQGSNGLPPSFLFLFSLVLLKIKHYRVSGGCDSERSFPVLSQNDGTHSCVCLILRERKKQPSVLIRKPLMQI